MRDPETEADGSDQMLLGFRDRRDTSPVILRPAHFDKTNPI
jgi:hypothetical protein